MNRTTIAVIGLAVALPGCQVPPDTAPGGYGSHRGTTTQPTLTLAEARELSRQVRTPEGRARWQTSCTSELPPEGDREIVGAMLKVPTAEAVTTYCTRMAAGIANGTLTPAEIVDAYTGRDYAPLVRVLVEPEAKE
jgi:hypothetical protein